MFLAFALLTLVGALSLLFQRNLVMAGLSMVVSFLGVSGLFLLLANPVAAALQIMVYSGAIVVLVLFVIMMLDNHEEEPADKNRPVQRWLGTLVVLLLGAGSTWVVMHSELAQQAPQKAELVTLERLGLSLFSGHLLAFEAAGLLLLAAMVAAVFLLKKDL